MRIWSISPKYLDTKGLLGVWRETLLAQKVLQGLTKGYKNHPQLIRFKRLNNPLLYIGTYLYYIYLEGKNRNYNFDLSKILKYDLNISKIPVTKEQVNYEFNHLLKKLKNRDIKRYEEFRDIKNIEVHPIFYIIEGDIEEWEKI
ncbi:pyrimidine dimer DNA glycosylase [Nanobdella aerobiophila]|uniref:Pyrimidine dimer DNA glycosylase n=1 Tax=Nanobdella aerobiophila TaxID=2586965 RepID=A0A915WS52_9ARCH|nr:pyrimidine dimer DNA glycosylase/endonuclease V [Nanobdella aerobiophila]BBL45551.1 pyrimidine dimer DNA glycosylase [Nanobdella aerobiophila]